MYKFIILYLSVCLCGVLCDLNKDEGAECEWEGVKGKCVKETRCLTTLDNRSPKQPVCSVKGEETIICCTDCELVNDTRNVIMSPKTGLLWKDGTKSRDNCLQYLKELPYNCRRGGFYTGITRRLDEAKKCHVYNGWGIGGSPPPGSMPGARYPHQAVLGYGDSVESAKWVAGGTIISNRYILTAAHATEPNVYGSLRYVALNVQNIKQSPSTWQMHKVKRYIVHPEFKLPDKYHDIALIETQTPIIFDKNVLPACLHVDLEETIEDAVTTTWKYLETDNDGLADSIQTIDLKKIDDEECKTVYSSHPNLKHGYDQNTQKCYASKNHPYESCRSWSGEPLLSAEQFARCIDVVVGVMSLSPSTCGATKTEPNAFTRVAFYTPWIENIVWP